MVRLIAAATLICGSGVALPIPHGTGPDLLADGGYDVQPSQRPSYHS
jgi:hypothetical protein